MEITRNKKELKFSCDHGIIHSRFSYKHLDKTWFHILIKYNDHTMIKIANFRKRKIVQETRASNIDIIIVGL